MYTAEIEYVFNLLLTGDSGTH